MEGLAEVQRQLMAEASHSTKLAYMKGIIDAEGLWDPVNRRLVISNTSQDLMSWLVDNFGGNISEQKWSAMTKKQSYQWRPSGAVAAEIVSSLQAPENMCEEEKKAFTAGFVDGDGTVYLHKRTRNGRIQTTPRVIVANSKDIPAVEFIHSVYGGALSIMQPRPGHPEKKPYAYLLIAGDSRAGGMIKDMLPYLIIKKSKAMEVLSARALI